MLKTALSKIVTGIIIQGILFLLTYYFMIWSDNKSVLVYVDKPIEISIDKAKQYTAFRDSIKGNLFVNRIRVENNGNKDIEDAHLSVQIKEDSPGIVYYTEFDPRTIEIDSTIVVKNSERKYLIKLDKFLEDEIDTFSFLSQKKIGHNKFEVAAQILNTDYEVIYQGSEKKYTWLTTFFIVVALNLVAIIIFYLYKKGKRGFKNRKEYFAELKKSLREEE